MNNNGCLFGGAIGYILMWAYFGITWIVNLIQFIQCDFAEPYKEEVIKALGVFIPGVSGITVWF